MRLNRFLAMAGIASRRKSETIIDAGRVKVNGVTATSPAIVVEPSADVVECDGHVVRLAATRRYVVVNKPRGVLSTVTDPRGRPVVVDLVPDATERLYPAGRLDGDTTGLVFLTNDGRLAHRVMHPRHRLPKRYVALVLGRVPETVCRELVGGVPLDDGLAQALEARCVACDGRRSVLTIVLGEGKKRQIRRMLRQLGHPVERLHRSSIGPLELSGLTEGACRDLTPFEVLAIRRAVRLSDA